MMGIYSSRIAFHLFSLFFLLACVFPLKAQKMLRSSIQGYVIETQTQTPVTGATVIILRSEPLIGTVTDSLGHFRLPPLKIGIYRVKVTHIGFGLFVSDPLVVSSGKETMTTVLLDQIAVTSPEV